MALLFAFTSIVMVSPQPTKLGGSNVGLNKEEQKMLKRLQAKAEEPDPPSIGRSLTAHIDLGDEKQVSLAKRYGFLPPDDEDLDESEDSESEDAESEDKPRRRGYFED